MMVSQYNHQFLTPSISIFLIFSIHRQTVFSVFYFFLLATFLRQSSTEIPFTHFVGKVKRKSTAQNVRCLTTPTIGLHAAVELTQAFIFLSSFKNEQCHLMKSEQQKFRK